MDDIMLKGIALWIIAVIDACFVFGAFILGYFVDGISPEFVGIIAGVLSACQVLIVILVKRWAKIED